MRLGCLVDQFDGGGEGGARGIFRSKPQLARVLLRQSARKQGAL